MRNNKITYFLAFCCFCLTVNAYSQQKQVSRVDFFAQLNKAEKSSQLKYSRRVETKGELFSEGKSEEKRNIIDERIAADKRRYVSVIETNGKTEKLELIQIGNKFYRRENNGNWKIETKWSGNNFPRTGPANSKEEVTVEDAKLDNQPVKLFQWLMTYKDESLTGTGKDKFRYSKLSYWVSRDGLMLKKETNNGFVEPKEVRFLETVVYQYNLNIKIEAPKTD